MYPAGAVTSVHVGRMGEVLEGAVRPGHFQGVATVVAMLLNLAQPDRAYFGQKDGQQSVVIRRIVHDLAIPVEIVICPTVREPDGLAMSSRNRYLTPDERAQAPALHAALQAATEALDAGEHRADRLRQLMGERLADATLGQVDYVSVADADTLTELETVDRPALASVAVGFPSARLIDCLPLGRGLEPLQQQGVRAVSCGTAPHGRAVRGQAQL
jgi:pantoate--beta-alanine ligase